MSNIYVGVIGGSTVSDEVFALAEVLGELLAKENAVVVCGGRTGVMTAVCKGAKSYGGTTIGILPSQTKEQANEFIDYAIATGIGIARNMVIINTADVLIAVDGAHGTLSEIALALNSGKKVIALHSKWSGIEGVIKVETAEEAVKTALCIVNKCR